MNKGMEKSLKFYQGTGYGEINTFLRDPDFNESVLTKHKDDPIVAHINNIDRSMDTNKFGKTKFFRGIAGSFIPQAVNASSGIIVNTSFTSTTSDEKVAKSYVDDVGCCILVFEIPDDLKTFVYKYKGNYSESEVLVQRNTQFKIVKKLGKNIYYAELFSYTPPKKVADLLATRRAQMLADEGSDWDFSDSEDDE